MKRTAFLLAALLLFCAETIRAEVYTIDFNRGTTSGKTSGYSGLPSNNAAAFCTEGWENIADYSESYCFYRNTGCGIRLGKTNGTGQANIVITFSEEIQSHSIEKIVVFASRGTDDLDAEMTVHAGTNAVTRAFSFADMKEYDASNPESSNYVLPDIVVDKKFKMLKIAARNTNFAMVHRIDIYTWDNEDAIHSPYKFVDEMGSFYNLLGQRIGKPSQGAIYIKDGKKYIFK